MSENSWFIELVDPDFDLPGWVHVPSGLEAVDRETWLADMTAALSGTESFDGTVVSPDVARNAASAALAIRSASPSLAVFQVWPPLGVETVFCHVNVLDSRDLPTWTETDAVVHPTAATHVGPGLQCVTRRVVDLPGGTAVELASVHLVFDDGDTTLMLSLDESQAPLIALALPGLVELSRNLRLVQQAGGKPFVSVAPDGVTEEDPWYFEELTR